MKSFKNEKTGGFSLIEVVLALGICSFCLIALLGLLSTGLNSNRDTVNQTEAAGIARMVQADIAARSVVDATGKLNAKTSRYLIDVPAAGDVKAPPLFIKEDGTTADATKATYRVDILFGKQTSAVSAIPVYILVTWPAAANPTSQWPEKPSGSFEAATAINP